MNIPASEMDELALLCRDIIAGAREQLAAEDDARVVLGKPMRVAREIGIWLVAFMLFAIGLAALPGCTKASDARERMSVLTAYAEAETADLKETQHSFSDKEPDTCDQVRAREPTGQFAECPSPCLVKIGASWCGPCHNERISEWAAKSGWPVHAYDWDADPDFCQTLGVTHLPTFIVVRNHREVARYTGTSIQEFLPILKEACK